VKSSDVQFNTLVFDNPNISSAAANQLAAADNKQSNNPFAVNYLTLVYIEYGIIFGIPAAVAATVIMAYQGFGTHAFGIGMTVLPNGKIMVTDVLPGTKISNVTVTYGPHGNVGR